MSILAYAAIMGASYLMSEHFYQKGVKHADKQMKQQNEINDASMRTAEDRSFKRSSEINQRMMDPRSTSSGRGNK